MLPLTLIRDAHIQSMDINSDFLLFLGNNDNH